MNLKRKHMKSLRKFFTVTILTLALTCTAFAGERGTGIVQPPPQPNSSVEGEMGTGVAVKDSTTAEEMSNTVDPITEITLNLLRSMLALF
jgi:hypothetical protein